MPGALFCLGRVSGERSLGNNLPGREVVEVSPVRRVVARFAGVRIVVEQRVQAEVVEIRKRTIGLQPSQDARLPRQSALSQVADRSTTLVSRFLQGDFASTSINFRIAAPELA